LASARIGPYLFDVGGSHVGRVTRIHDSGPGRQNFGRVAWRGCPGRGEGCGRLVRLSDPKHPNRRNRAKILKKGI
ncbi:hypothetical protein, partial [Infirmifilum sp.]|uniref:hypothetical protein n=1 Tax=Infirmifilum sp. TaxID=2856575 RepID=UPI003D0F051F